MKNEFKNEPDLPPGAKEHDKFPRPKATETELLPEPTPLPWRKPLSIFGAIAITFGSIWGFIGNPLTPTPTRDPLDRVEIIDMVSTKAPVELRMYDHSADINQLQIKVRHLVREVKRLRRLPTPKKWGSELRKLRRKVALLENKAQTTNAMFANFEPRIETVDSVPPGYVEYRIYGGK